MTTLLALLSAFLPQQSMAEGKVPWMKDFAQAQQTAKRAGKPLFLYFSCG